MQRSLQDLVADGRTWAHTGIVDAVEAHETWGYQLTVTLQPGGEQVLCRPTWFGSGSAGQGLWWPIEVGAEALVLCPDGDWNAAVALVGPVSGAAPPPSDWANDLVSIVHGGGVELRRTAGAPVLPVLIESLLPDLQAALTEINTLVVGLGFPATNLATLLSRLPTEYRSPALSAEE